MTKKIVNYLKEIAYEYKLIDLLRKFYWMVKSSIRVGEKVSITIDSVESVFYVNSSTEYSVVNAIYDESEVIKKIMEECQDGDVFWDIGANIGTFSCMLKHKNIHTVCFEPYRPNVNALEKNLDANNASYEIMEMALSNFNGKAGFSVNYSEQPGSQQGSIVTNYAEGRVLKTTEVQVKKGDSLVESGKTPAPNIAKMDVEGAAIKVIEGMENVLRNNKCRLVCIESHNNIKEIRKKITNIGFRIKNINLSGERSGDPPTMLCYGAEEFK